jgi:hypothetical protein
MAHINMRSRTFQKASAYCWQSADIVALHLNSQNELDRNDMPWLLSQNMSLL